VTQYDSLADVYEFLTPEALLTPEGNVDAFAPWLPAGARVLDCACGTGLLAVGLARRGFDVHASDASPEMVRRTRAHGVGFPARVCAWEDLPPSQDFDVVLCVGNSLPHARDRVAALRGMARALRPGGRLVLTSRNWERGQPAERREVERDGRRALVTYAWADGVADVTVAVEGETVAERLTFWPFAHGTLLAELRAVGIEPVESTYAPDAERYLVTGRRAGAARGTGSRHEPV
jgi:2-polyprenyl-3-methyl-5-hydroxy-6-metoxy-1,4-benzoquinol methylase